MLNGFKIKHFLVVIVQVLVGWDQHNDVSYVNFTRSKERKYIYFGCKRIPSCNSVHILLHLLTHRFPANEIREFSC